MLAAKLKSNFPLDVKTLCLIIQLSKSLDHFRNPLHITWIEMLSQQPIDPNCADIETLAVYLLFNQPLYAAHIVSGAA